MRTSGAGIRNVNVDDLSERIKIIRSVRVRNERGDFVRAGEEVIGECWAKVLPRGSARRVENGIELRDEISYTVTVRYRSDVDVTDEIEWRGRRMKQETAPFDVESQRKWLQMECVEGKADAGVSGL